MIRRLLGLVAILLLLAGCSSPGADPWPSDTASPTLPAGHWTELPAGPLSARHDPVASWAGGRFVVLGGRTDRPCSDTGSCAGPFQPAERDGASFDPATGRWRSTATAPSPVAGRNAVVVDDAVYVLVEKTEQEPAALLRYDPGTDRWTRLTLPGDRAATLVAGDHRVFAVPGFSDGAAVRLQVLDTRLEDASWRMLPADPLGSADFRQATWFDGRLMLAGPRLATSSGGTAGRVRITWWDPRNDHWSSPTDTKVAGWDPTTVGPRIVWPGHGAAVAGSGGDGAIYDPASETWTGLPDPLDRDGLDRASGLVVGSRIVVGEPSAGADSGRGQLLDPVSRHWTALQPLPGPGRYGQALAAGHDAIFVWGGGTAKEENLADGYLLRP